MKTAFSLLVIVAGLAVVGYMDHEDQRKEVEQFCDTVAHTQDLNYLKNSERYRAQCNADGTLRDDWLRNNR